MRTTSAFLFLTAISLTTATIVKWLPSTSFNLPTNFKSGKLPCSKQNVVFPETIDGSVRFNSDISVKSFILPVTSDMVLADGVISFGVDSSDTHCTDESDVYYMDNSVSAWSQPDVWSSSRFNKATPDAERVPCYNDIVLFPQDSQFVLRLPQPTQTVREFRIGNQTFSTRRLLQRIWKQSNQQQQFVLNDHQNVGITVTRKICRSRGSCPCQDLLMEIDCNAKYCAVPQCVNPIKPKGHCCRICGGAILFDIDQSFDMMDFKEFVEKIVESYGRDKLVYHLSRLQHNKVQLVVVEKDEYVGTSAEVVNEIDHSMLKHWAQGLKTSEISGSPISKAGLGGKIVVSMFFFVIFVMGVLYAYYYKLPEVQFPVRGFGGPRGMMSRFQRRTDSVVSLTRRDSGVPIGSGAGTAFRNPLYDSKRGRVQIAESTVEE